MSGDVSVPQSLDAATRMLAHSDYRLGSAPQRELAQRLIERGMTEHEYLIARDELLAGIASRR